MSKVVWKFPLTFNGGQPQTLNMPQGAKIVHTHQQGDNPTMWAEVIPIAPKEERTFIILATGFSHIPEVAQYVGTVHEHSTVWHIYEIRF